MIRNYLKIALRSLRKNKLYSFINIFGLALGITSSLLIMLYVKDELSFDKFNKNAGRIYRVNSDIVFGGTHFHLAVAQDPLAATLMREYPQVESACRFREQGSFLVKKGKENIKEQKVIFADNQVFDVFTLPMLIGNPKSALKDPFTMVLNKTTAEKYFGSVKEAYGKTLVLDNKDAYKVTGVIANIPPQSHFNFDIFLAMEGLEESKQNNWISNNFSTYLLFKEGTDPKKVEASFEDLLIRYEGPQIKSFLNMTIEEFKKAGSKHDLTLMPLTDIHLHSDRTGELGPNGNIKYVYIFSAIAFFVLLIACINFMNLSTARSANRAKEVGVRKVLGSEKSSLIGQFLTESVLVSFISLLIAIIATYLLLPAFNNLANKQIVISFWQILPMLLLIVVFVGFLAGSYPAFYLSSFIPINVLKGKLQAGMKSSGFRSTLVIFQFATSIVLMIGTFIIYKQLQYIQTKNLGFNKDQVVIVNDAYALDTKLEAFKNEVLRNPTVQSGTVSSYLPVPSSRSDDPFFPEGIMEPDKAVSMQDWKADYDYVKTLGLKIIKGRDFNRTFGSDSLGVIINESAVKLFGYKDPIGKRISKIINGDTKVRKVFTIIGVVENFHFESLRENVGALSLALGTSKGAISFRVKTDDIQATVNTMESIWKQFAPGQPFNYSFLDQEFDSMYRSEQRIGKIFIIFASLAILIACLGLFGLATYAAEQRTKEIGIRKVLGANVKDIVAMLSKDFIRLVLIAIVFAVPIAWYGMSNWLKDFAFRIEISWWVFVIAGVLALLIALLTISYQAVRAALMNPVKSLKTE